MHFFIKKWSVTKLNVKLSLVILKIYILFGVTLSVPFNACNTATFLNKNCFMQHSYKLTTILFHKDGLRCRWSQNKDFRPNAHSKFSFYCQNKIIYNKTIKTVRTKTTTIINIIFIIYYLIIVVVNDWYKINPLDFLLLVHSSRYTVEPRLTATPLIIIIKAKSFFYLKNPFNTATLLLRPVFFDP